MSLTAGTIVVLLLVGVLSGMLSGLIGIGGGIIIVPCLVFFLAFPQKMAQGTSLAVLTLPVVFLGMWQYQKQGYVDFKMVAFLALGFCLGSYFGGKIAVNLPDAILKKIFAVILILVAIKLLFLDKDKNNEKQTTTTISKAV